MEHFISFSGTVQHTYEIRVAEMERSNLRRTGPPESNRTTRERGRPVAVGGD
jgi:hypothetical protein